MCHLKPKKPVVGVGETSNFTQTQITLCLKKHVKITFLPEQSNMVKMGSKILKYLLNFFIVKKYLVCLSEACVQLVSTILSILPAECLNYN